MARNMLSNTAYVILGLLQKGPLSGYDIKSKVDISTRFFFSASYGQIYPELKRLEAGGLIKGTELMTGRRARTEYELTDAGRDALLNWLRTTGACCEMRDEGMLKFFFGGGLGREDLLDKIAGVRAERAEIVDQLKAIAEDIPPEADELQISVLAFGLELYQFVIDWCDRVSAEFETRDAGEFPVDRENTFALGPREPQTAGERTSPE